MDVSGSPVHGRVHHLGSGRLARRAQWTRHPMCEAEPTDLLRFNRAPDVPAASAGGRRIQHTDDRRRTAWPCAYL